MQIENVNRFYYKCLDCLTAFAVGERVKALQCACGGIKVEYMGQVKRDRLMRIEEKCACDARCTNAQGPVCDCSCGGVNHGTGRTVKIVVECGIPKALVDEVAIARGQAWRAKLKATEYALCARFGDAYVSYRNGKFISDRSTWVSIRGAERELANARKSKVHKTRIAKLDKLAA